MINTQITENLSTLARTVQKRNATGRGSSKKIDLYGIKKLRELILELAVRGKLVPQNTDDEPASVLLERIAEERGRLVKEKKIKKPKKLLEIGEDEKPFELPEGWQWERLGNFVSIIRGITFPASEKSHEPSNGRIACLRTANIQEQIDWNDLIFVDKKFVKRSEQYLEVGDIVMSMANSKELVGKVSFTLQIPTTTASFGGFLSVIRPYQISANYLMTILRTPHVRKTLIGSASQTTNIANISLEKLNPLLIAVPPLAEQHRIVAKVDELMTLCDQIEQQTEANLSAHATLVENLLSTLTNSANAEELEQNWQRIAEHFTTLFTTEESIDQLKQTILQLAVMGKLVPQDPNDEPASQLLERIAAEKAQLIKEKKIKKQKALPPITEDEKPFELPEGWEAERIGTFSIVGTGATPSRSQPQYWEPKEINWVTSGETAELFVRDTKEKVSKLAIKETNVTIYPVGTLIVAMYGQGKTRGQITELLTEAGTNQACAAIRLFDSSEQHKNYVKLFFRKAYEELRSNAAGGAQPNLNVGKVANTIIPIPPLAEQQRIVEKVNQLMRLCDQIKVHLQQQQQTRIHLTDAMVATALA
ncbi:restriction endonuclease subunit S [Endozoicomonas sp. Mp262]|uniref:restriction endonuclease subunit S n=1 Tax=Endozoicomonas sp. Mp262 TaxID=2919499 RepID=UPI0021D95059